MITTTALVLLSMAQCPNGQCRPQQFSVPAAAKQTVSVLVNKPVQVVEKAPVRKFRIIRRFRLFR